ncbi:hypothetical protein LTR64_000155 [Lithohypha guttulata]|uniref:AAA+ ATPase domain-containing protein n=1 Tax=Lithohypha guttulata TaxID=1690604 RepID=A0AAN7STW9_9EURO|nr:hypothetical protein LTR51_007517 [Lithohypha guttulata]KAK5081283.1 hypothetical protein LTR05_008077 [Lithohypha guttulata]
MMRSSKPIASMQKTYDECYLICSTAVFFESQNNETEALRSWREALAHIYQHNATRASSAWYPKTGTERSLMNALNEMENQCKERVDLLTALKDSRTEAGQSEPSSNLSRASLVANNGSATWLGDGSIPPAQLSQIPSSSSSRPPLPIRRKSSGSVLDQPGLGVPPNLPVPVTKKASRSPSPDQRRPMRTTLRPEKKGMRYARNADQPRPNTLKAAGLAWDSRAPRSSSTAKTDYDPTIEARLSAQAARRSLDMPRNELDPKTSNVVSMPDPADYASPTYNLAAQAGQASYDPRPSPHSPRRSYMKSAPDLRPQPESSSPLPPATKDTPPPIPTHRIKPAEIKYRKEFFGTTQSVPQSQADAILRRAYAQPDPNLVDPKPTGLARKPVGSPVNTTSTTRPPIPKARQPSADDIPTSSRRPRSQARVDRSHGSGAITPPSTDDDSLEDESQQEPERSAFELRVEALLANLPKGVDPFAAKQILNEIVVQGDEVHWEDVAGLNAAKKALKEAVVYPFLRPDLFSGLREPARGMLLFGPPGTGKTMLARAVATESKSTFFAITASTLTSKWHGESEKLVRALFALAKALAPSIIFVDEIDSLLNSRGGGTEHEASRRSKTEFLIGWSDLQRAAAGKDTSIGDATRVLVLAATNCPWDIDEAARRRFVRRQYIPLPELETREAQLRTLLKSQKHSLSERDIVTLTALTDGYSGSDITALCKDAAMQPLRNLGEALLTTPIDQIRPISLSDFRSSLANIRPSVGKKGLEQFEEWAAEYGERGA